jgi:hypothetical protein
MSELGRLIKAEKTTRRVPQFSALLLDLASVSSNFSSRGLPGDYYTEYNIGVKLGYRQLISDIDIQQHSDNILKEVERRGQEAIIQAVFGEFREPLYRLRIALYESGTRDSRVMELLDKLEHQLLKA